MLSRKPPLPREWLLKKIHRALGCPAIRIAMASGEAVVPQDCAPTASVVIGDDSTLLSLCLNPDTAFGDAYTDGRLRIEGDLAVLLETVDHPSVIVPQRTWGARQMCRWLHWIQRNTLRGSRRNIHRHYDLPADFYRLWLDKEMVYTCAYFPSPSATLEVAQVAKMDHVCRKVWLQPGERVVEAGCGWGSLALHMARNYGARVRAFNISHEQIAFARERARQEGLEGRVEFIEDDYRNITGEYDVFMSVGMLEHVGPEHYETLGDVMQKSIGSSGRGLLHFIGYNRPRTMNPWLLQHIFPGAYVPSLREALLAIESAGFSTRDVENLRLHYALTMQHWLERFEAAVPQLAPPLNDEHFVRAWRLYLAGVMSGFRAGILQLFQVVFAGALCRQLPWTRAYLYSEAEVKEPEPWTAVTS